MVSQGMEEGEGTTFFLFSQLRSWAGVGDKNSQSSGDLSLSTMLIAHLCIVPHLLSVGTLNYSRVSVFQE